MGFSFRALIVSTCSVDRTRGMMLGIDTEEP
jgi:hypothetical protein